MGLLLTGVFKRSSEWPPTQKVDHLTYGPYGIDLAKMLMTQVGEGNATVLLKHALIPLIAIYHYYTAFSSKLYYYKNSEVVFCAKKHSVMQMLCSVLCIVAL